MNQSDALRRRLALPAYPRSAGYDPQWQIETVMGPNPIWLAEALTQVLPLAPGMRVLDLGCGRAATSIFLGKEFGAAVYAADLWIKPSENWARIEAAGLGSLVTPLYAEAHALPFADRFFDAIVSFDAYHYFGTDDLYLAYIARFLKPGGRLGIVVPGLRAELADGQPPAHARPFWDPGFISFHTPAWWRSHWERTGAVDVELADMLPDGWRHWLLWNEVCAEASASPRVRESAAREADMLRVDAGRSFGFARAIARAR